MKNDTCSEVNLINPSTLEGLPVDIKELDGGIMLQGINNDVSEPIYGIARLKIIINGYSLPISLLLFNGIPHNVVQLGIPFQWENEFSIYCDLNEKQQMVQFTNNNNNIHFPLKLIQVPKVEVNNVETTVEQTDNQHLQNTYEIIKPVLEKSNLPPIAIKEFQRRLAEIDGVFQHPNDPPGRLKEHISPPVKLRLKPHEKWQFKSIPLKEPAKRTAAIELLRELIRDGILVYSNSEYRNPWFMLPKRDQPLKYRLLVDLRTLNANSLHYAGHSSSVDELVSSIAGRKFLTIIDIALAFFQIPLETSTADPTAIVTPLGLLNFSVLPQGYANSPSIFQNIINKVLLPVIEHVTIFMDDIAVKGPTPQQYDEDPTTSSLQHVERVIQVLKLIQDAGLKIKCEKLKLGVKECTYLGYTITEKGRTLPPGRIEEFKNYPLPTTRRGLEKFLGASNYFRALIPNYATITAPLYELATSVPKGNIQWSPSHKQHFTHLLQLLSSAPVVAPLDYDLQLTIHTDASLTAWSGVLENTYENKPPTLVYCVSGKFQGAAVHYSIFEKELYSLYLTLQSLQHHLMGYDKPLKIYCDNKGLVQLLNSPATKSTLQLNRIVKWTSFIRSFNYQIYHIPTEKNIIADTLSRIYEDEDMPKLEQSIKEALNDFKGNLKVQSHSTIVTTTDAKYEKIPLKYIEQFLKDNTIPTQYQAQKKSIMNFILKAHEFFLHDDQLYKLGAKGQFARRVITEPLDIETIFKDSHDNRGHLKLSSAYNLINLRYYIPRCFQLLTHYIQSCETCQHYDGTPFAKDPLFLHIPVGLFETIVCDCVYMDDAYLVVARDSFSGWPEARVLTLLTGALVADFIAELFIHRIGCFKEFHTDQGSEFKNQFVARLTQHHNIQHTFAIANHPQGNGLVERGHQNLINFLKKLPDGLDWKNYVSKALWVERTNIRSTTGYSPQYMVFGFQGYSNLDAFYEIYPQNKSYTDEELFKFRFLQLNYRDIQFHSALETTIRQRIKHKHYFDKKNEVNIPLDIGDLVLVWDRPIKNPFGNKMKKLSQRWSGPYKVIGKEERKYYLEDMAGVKLAREFSREMMKKYVEREIFARGSLS